MSLPSSPSKAHKRSFSAACGHDTSPPPVRSRDPLPPQSEVVPQFIRDTRKVDGRFRHQKNEIRAKCHLNAGFDAALTGSGLTSGAPKSSNQPSLFQTSLSQPPTNPSQPGSVPPTSNPLQSGPVQSTTDLLQSGSVPQPTNLSSSDHHATFTEEATDQGVHDLKAQLQEERKRRRHVEMELRILKEKSASLESEKDTFSGKRQMTDEQRNNNNTVDNARRGGDTCQIKFATSGKEVKILAKGLQQVNEALGVMKQGYARNDDLSKENIKLVFEVARLERKLECANLDLATCTSDLNDTVTHYKDAVAKNNTLNKKYDNLKATMKQKAKDWDKERKDLTKRIVRQEQIDQNSNLAMQLAAAMDTNANSRAHIAYLKKLVGDMLVSVTEDVRKKHIETARALHVDFISAPLPAAKFTDALHVEETLETAAKNKAKLKSMSKGKNPLHKELSKDFREGCYEAVLKAKTAYMASNKENGGRGARRSRRAKGKYYLAGDRIDYVEVTLEADGFTPENPEDVLQEMQHGIIYGMRGQTKYVANKPCPEYDPQGEAWRYDMIAVIQELGKQEETERAESLSWANDIIEEAVVVPWKRYRLKDLSNDHSAEPRYHTWVLKGSGGEPVKDR